MEENLSQGGMIPGGASFGGINLQESMRVRHHQAQNYPHTMLPHHHSINPRQGSSVHSSLHEGLPLTIGTIHSCDETISMNKYNKGETGKSTVSDDDDPSFTEEGGECHNDVGKGKKGSLWQRVKWTDKMVKLLITAVSYVGEDTSSDCGVGGGARRKFAVLQKKGKWKAISKVMAQRSFNVSPQQCEDKFNDLNKRYKKLNDMLGRGTSCQIVENPSLLDVIDFLTEKEKDDVKKILSSKHLFYEEMCSYHNSNRLHLPHDLALQRSLQLALRNKDDHDHDDEQRHQHDPDEDDHCMETDSHDEFEDSHTSHGESQGTYGVARCSTKRQRQGHGHEDVCLGNSMNYQDFQKISYPPSQSQQTQAELNQPLPESTRAAWLQKQWIESRSLQLEEQKIQIQVEMLELEKQRFKWQRFSKKRDRELEKLRMENERMKLENERMALELKQKRNEC